MIILLNNDPPRFSIIISSLSLGMKGGGGPIRRGTEKKDNPLPFRTENQNQSHLEPRINREIQNGTLGYDFRNLPLGLRFEDAIQFMTSTPITPESRSFNHVMTLLSGGVNHPSPNISQSRWVQGASGTDTMLKLQIYKEYLNNLNRRKLNKYIEMKEKEMGMKKESKEPSQNQPADIFDEEYENEPEGKGEED